MKLKVKAKGAEKLRISEFRHSHNCSFDHWLKAYENGTLGPEQQVSALYIAQYYGVPFEPKKTKNQR